MPRREQLKTPTEPTLFRRAEVPYVVWGDDESGYVNDLFYVLSKQMVLVTVTMPPGARFRSSDRFRAYFDTHECLYVLRGQYTCLDPETGEVRTARAGEMLFMPEKRWHYGHNFGSEELHLLECIAPPTNQSALAHVPRPREVIGWDTAAAGNWPRECRRSASNLRVCRLDNALEAIVGSHNPLLFSILASTERVFFGVVTIPPRARSDDMTFPFDLIYHGDTGEVTAHAPESGEYFPIDSGDVGFLPAGTTHRLFNHTASTQRILVGGAGCFGRVTCA
jgi:mannose-6-phosphate isomerase-like protein (cupin superfamily)